MAKKDNSREEATHTVLGGLVSQKRGSSRKVSQEDITEAFELFPEGWVGFPEFSRYTSRGRR